VKSFRSATFGQTGLGRGGQLDLPARQLHHVLGPLAPGQTGRPPALELAEAAHEVAGQPLLADAVAFQEPGDHGKDLPGLHRFDEVVVHLDADGLAEGAFVFALGDHHHGHGGIDAADFTQELEAAASGHLLVEQHDAVGLPAQQRQGVVSMGRLLDGKSLLLEKAAVPGESFDFVIDPQDALGARHVRKS
jgi:hypothetical protein